MVFECTVGKSLQDPDLRYGVRSLLHRFIAVPGVAGIKHSRMTQRYNSREGNPEQHNAVDVNVGGQGTPCAGEPPHHCHCTCTSRPCFPCLHAYWHAVKALILVLMLFDFTSFSLHQALHSFNVI